MDRDVVIIGGGPAGYAAAIRVCQLGGRATIVEEGEIGGTCLNYGCIPVGVLMRAVYLMEEMKASRDFGVDYRDLSLDYGRLMSRKEAIVKGLRAGVSMLLEANGVEVIKGRGKVLAQNVVAIAKDGGTKELVKARKIILATGARFSKKDLHALEPAEVLELRTMPNSVIIYGSDVVSLSLATLLSRLGSKVVLLLEEEGFAPDFDKETSTILQREITKAGVELSKVEGSTSKEGAVAVRFQRHVPMEELLEVELEMNAKGGVLANARMETSLKDLYACGDVTMEHMFTHVAYMEGIVAAENAMGLKSEIDYKVVPIFAHTLPEIAGVGLKEEEAQAAGYELKVGRFPLTSSGAAMVLGKRTGMVKVICDGKYGQILGVHMIGPYSSLLISEAALAMRLEATFEDVGQTMHCHPTLSEAFWEAARNVDGKAVHSIQRR